MKKLLSCIGVGNCNRQGAVHAVVEPASAASRTTESRRRRQQPPLLPAQCRVSNYHYQVIKNGSYIYIFIKNLDRTWVYSDVEMNGGYPRPASSPWQNFHLLAAGTLLYDVIRAVLYMGCVVSVRHDGGKVYTTATPGPDTDIESFVEKYAHNLLPTCNGLQITVIAHKDAERDLSELFAINRKATVSPMFGSQWHGQQTRALAPRRPRPLTARTHAPASEDRIEPTNRSNMSNKSNQHAQQEPPLPGAAAGGGGGRRRRRVPSTRAKKAGKNTTLGQRKNKTKKKKS
jgi:hypothetical protein